MPYSVPYVNVSVNNNYNTYGLPYNPVIGQSYVDAYGNNQIWDGYTWINSNLYLNNINYNMGYNSMYTTVGSSSMNTNAYSAVSDNDISIVCRDGSVLHVGETLSFIKKQLGMIDPDSNLMEKYPAVKSAYDDYQTEFAKMLSTVFPNLQAAIDSYNIVVSLVKIEEANANDDI